MTAQELRKKFLEFFQRKKHTIIPSASLIPENDPTALFTTAGMHPLSPYLMGEKHPQGRRLADVQKCVRTVDIDAVGDSFHHTFFEMLGNWSLGDYFKKEAIEWSFEFLTQELNIPIEKLAVSVFQGDKDASLDEESIKIWKNLNIPEGRIAYLSQKDNWWGPVGEFGPCGPDTEIFYWTAGDTAPEKFDADDKKWVEIWNNVFMEYNKTKEGYELLKQKNVDTGMGLERMLAILNGLNDDYQTELFVNLIGKIEKLSDKKYQELKKEMRVIADHLKAAAFIISENISPSNTDRGYIVRRLVRRAIRYGRQLGIKKELWTKEIALTVVDDYKNVYSLNSDFIVQKLDEEEIKFGETLEKGLSRFNKLDKISGADAFNLYQTYGFPIEMTEELAREKGVEINQDEFQEEFKKHQELSRTASAGKFKSGLADAGEQTKKLHTATHLLLAALRRVLGGQVFQKGSNITAERLRFDFSHQEKMTQEQLKEVEKIVNEVIQKNLPVECRTMTLEKAKKEKAMGVFESKYDKKVKVYSIGDFSKEICSGPHATRTGELGCFKIIKEESSSAGVRRIKAILEQKS